MPRAVLLWCEKSVECNCTCAWREVCRSLHRRNCEIEMHICVNLQKRGDLDTIRFPVGAQRVHSCPSVPRCQWLPLRPDQRASVQSVETGSAASLGFAGPVPLGHVSTSLQVEHFSLVSEQKIVTLLICSWEENNWKRSFDWTLCWRAYSDVRMCWIVLMDSFVSDLKLKGCLYIFLLIFLQYMASLLQTIHLKENTDNNGLLEGRETIPTTYYLQIRNENI